MDFRPGILANPSDRSRGESHDRRPLITRRRLLVVASITVVFILLLVAVTRWVDTHHLQSLCQSHLRSIGQAFNTYRSDLRSHELPPSFETFLDFVVAKGDQFSGTFDPRIREDQRNRFREAIRCPGPRTANGSIDELTYDYIAAGRVTTPEMIVMHDSACRHRGGMNVLFASGQVRWLNARESADMLADLAAGKNPPPSLNAKK